MTNPATENRDRAIARLIEAHTVIVWADGFGSWHVKVPVTMPDPHDLARYTLRLMLQERAPRDTYVDPPKTVLVESDDTHHHYRESWV